MIRTLTDFTVTRYDFSNYLGYKYEIKFDNPSRPVGLVWLGLRAHGNDNFFLPEQIVRSGYSVGSYAMKIDDFYQHQVIYA